MLYVSTLSLSRMILSWYQLHGTSICGFSIMFEGLDTKFKMLFWLVYISGRWKKNHSDVEKISLAKKTLHQDLLLKSLKCIWILKLVNIIYDIINKWCQTSWACQKWKESYKIGLIHTLPSKLHIFPFYTPWVHGHPFTPYLISNLSKDVAFCRRGQQIFTNILGTWLAKLLSEAFF